MPSKTHGVTLSIPTWSGHLADRCRDAKVRIAMSVAVQAKTASPRNVCQRRVLKTSPKGLKTECVFTDGTAILVSPFLASLIRAGDDLLFSLDIGQLIRARRFTSGTQITAPTDLMSFKHGLATRQNHEKISGIISSFRLKSRTRGLGWRPSTCRTRH
jgi:hypothetical protein